MSLRCLCLKMAIRKIFFFVRNFYMTITLSGTMKSGAKVRYLFMLVRIEALRQFDSLSADVESTNPLTVENIIKGLAFYFSL